MKRIRPKHYWRKALRSHPQIRAFEIALCNAQGTINMLSTKAQPSLGWFGRMIAFLTTPFKRIGISGWKETGCVAKASGYPVRKAQHSTDGFWTIDVELRSFKIVEIDSAGKRYIRIEVEPGTEAHKICSKNTITTTDGIFFGGPVVIDTDGPFLEIHPDEDFSVEASVP